MADQRGITLFGFEIKRKENKDTKLLPSIVTPTSDDGAAYATAAGAHFSYQLDLDRAGHSRDQAQQIQKYRGVSMHPEVDMAIDEIVNEAISMGEIRSVVELNLEEVKLSQSIKNKIKDEFSDITSMLNFNDNGSDLFKRWYIDGRIFHHLVVDEKNPKLGIQDIRYIDSAKMRKVKQVKTEKDPATGAKVVVGIDEYYIYQEKPVKNIGSTAMDTGGIKLTTDSISYVPSGLLDESQKHVVSYLHKAIKPINQLRMMEDSLVIYRLARAPERRIFYIDVGNKQPQKAEEYMRQIQAKYRNKLVYDASTGALRDDRKHMSMLEDFWLPRMEGGRGTEISTLPGGDNLGQMDDVIYFQKAMYRSLNVPINRLEQEQQFSLGRSNEITRDEIKFQKFIDRLRRKFSKLFLDILKKQLVLKQIITEEDWEEWKNDIIVDYISDNNFAELRDAELLRERFQTLDVAAQYIGEYVSKEWAMKNILMLDEDEYTKMLGQIEDEQPEYEEEEPEEEAEEPQEEPSSKPSIDINVNHKTNEEVSAEEMQLEVTKQLTDLLKK